MRMVQLVFLLVISFLSSLFMHSEAAAAVYVTDSFEITLRTGPSIQNKIIDNIPTGQSLKVLETQNDWTRVRWVKDDESSREGWVLSRYLIDRAPWEVQAKTLERENLELKEKLAGVEAGMVDLTQREKELMQAAQTASEALGKLEAEYTELRNGAADYLRLKEESDSLRSELSAAQEALRTIRDENERLKSSREIRWFLTGVGVLLSGWMIGLIMGRYQKKRRASYYA